MAIDWGEAVRIGSWGFGTVFVILIILAVTIWFIGFIFSKTGTSEDEASNNQKGA